MAKSMLATIADLIGRFLLTLFVASVVIFLLMRAVPGNPARVALGVNATDEAVAELTESLGLNRPLLTQYWEWLSGLLRGDFGTSLASQSDITPLVLDRAQVSFILIGLSLLLALAIALPMGTWLAARSGTPSAGVVSALVQVGIAVPSFLVGIVFVAIFAIGAGWVPANGWVPPNQDVGDFAARLVLPVISLAMVQAAILTRYTRSAVLDVLGQDYLRTARALGQSRSEALLRHGLRNAALPIITVAGVQLTTLVVGSVVIENVFAIPGLGSMLLDAVGTRDLTTVQTLVMLLVAFTLVVNLVVDVAYRVVDPRLRPGAAPAWKGA